MIFRPTTSATPSASAANRTSRPWGRPVFALLALVAIAATVSAVVRVDRMTVAPPADLCEELPRPTAALLVDLRKPMRGAAPGAAVREVARRIDTGVELKVYAVTTDRLSPRRFVGGLCRPFDNEDLAVSTAKDSGAEARDCSDLPTQIGPELRETAMDYCAKRMALMDQVDAAAAGTGDVRNAYLMESLEDTMEELAADTASKTLYVFSDMLQHAHWYSHLDLEWPDWRFEDFEAVRDVHDPAFHADRPAGLAVQVLYVPRLGLTDAARAKAIHRAFWRRYFDGADIAFEEHATLPGFVGAPLMDVASDAGAVVRQREALATWRADAEASLRDIETERQAIAAQQRDAVAAVGRLETDLAELRTTRLALRTERQALQAELNAAREAAAKAMEAAAASAPPVVEAPAPAVCQLDLQPTFEAPLLEERRVGDRRRDFGAATVAIRYAVTAQGLILDDTLSLEPARSTATVAENLDVLAEDAFAVVRDWQFALDCEGDLANDAQQWGTATFSYRRKCVGAPIPQCWTVRSAVALSSGDENP